MLSVEGLKDLYLGQSEVVRCKTLRYSYDASEEGDLVPLGIGRLALIEWHGFAFQEDDKPPYDVSSLVIILQVCVCPCVQKSDSRSSSSLPHPCAKCVAERVHVQPLLVSWVVKYNLTSPSLINCHHWQSI